MIFSKLDLKNVCSTNSTFHIYIDNTKSIIYKKIKSNGRGHILKIRIKKDPNKYKNTILNTSNQNICSVKSFDIEDDGSYKCNYIKGFTLYQIQNRNNLKLSQSIIQEKSDIISAIEDLKKKIKKNNMW